MILQNSLARSTASIRNCAANGLLFTGTRLIAQCGILLKIPQTAIATAQTIFTRFYVISDTSEYPIQDTVLASLFLASKTEECGRRIKDIVNVYFAIKIFNECNKSAQDASEKMAAFVDVPFDVYEEYKEAVIKCEISILARLAFHVHVQHPHGFMVNYLQSLGISQQTRRRRLEDDQANKDQPSSETLAQFCWNCLNDLHLTEVIVYFQPNVIACAVIYFGAATFDVVLPQSPPWWELFDVVEQDILVICDHLMSLYHTHNQK